MTDTIPYAAFLDIRSERDAAGELLLVMPAAEKLVGRPGCLHGGAIAGLLEIAGYAALREALEARSGASPALILKPISVSVDFMRTGHMIDSRAGARITRLGRRIANIAVEAWQLDRTRPIASARMTVLLDRN